MSKNMAKIRKPACMPDNLTMSLDEHSTDTEEEDEVEYQNTTYSTKNKEYDGKPFCCIPRGEGVFIAVDPTITRVPDTTFTQQNAHSEGMTSQESSDARVDYTDLGPWKNFQIPENIEVKKIPPGGHRSYPGMQPAMPCRNVSAYQDQQHILDLKEVTDHRKKAPRYYSTPETSGFRGGRGTEQSSVWGQGLSSFEPTNSDAWAGGVRMDSFNVIKYMTPSPQNIKVPARMVQSYPHPMKSPHKLAPNLSRYSRASPPDATFRRTEETHPRSLCPATQANVLNATQNISQIVHPDYTYSRTPRSSKTFDACSCRRINIPSNLQKLNVSPGAHRTFPTAKQHRPLATFSTHEDKQPIMDLRELAEYRKRAPRYYSTPERDDFLNQGTDQSSVWGQDLSSFKSAETSAPEDSSLGWSQGVRMDSFNVIKHMTPSPKNVNVAPRLIRSYPHLTPSSNRQEPNLTQYSKVVFPDSIGNQSRNYNLQCQNLVTDTFCNPQNSTNLRSEPTADVTYQTPKPKVKFDPRQYTYSQPESDPSLNKMQNATFVGSEKKVDPASLPQMCAPCGGNRTFPITQHPQPPMTFSTHEQQQPILDVKEVAEHRKKAPRYYSTPEREDFSNEGFNESSVWGQDLSSFISVDSNTVEDSSLGWSQGVRMDSFNVIKYMTVSPKDVKVPPRQMLSCPGELRRKIRDPQSLKKYSIPSGNAAAASNLTHSLEPRTPVNVTYNAKSKEAQNQTYCADMERGLNQTYPVGNTRAINRTYSAQPEGAFNQTYSAAPVRRNQTYSADMERGLNQTCPVGNIRAINRTYSAEPEGVINQTYSAAPVRRNQTYSADMERGLNQTYPVGNIRAINRTYSAQPEGAINQTYSVPPVARDQTFTQETDATNCECPNENVAQNDENVAQHNANVTQNLNDLVMDPCSNQNITRTHVPRPSRNYLTYVEKTEK
ncbi:hypothetical protein WA026_007223 [Henosepilachna vigintioctopunctata]|uniref:Uncharacterized protein n=1 Tax=Henosepilachna vigintioctopunctata TaxID=420089 RepID=A0AAW1V2F0_9CUCU